MLGSVMRLLRLVEREIDLHHPAARLAVYDLHAAAVAGGLCQALSVGARVRREQTQQLRMQRGDEQMWLHGRRNG
eukprot:8376222-Pyramimonas_sp.AAC.1